MFLDLPHLLISLGISFMSQTDWISRFIVHTEVFRGQCPDIHRIMGVPLWLFFLFSFPRWFLIEIANLCLLHVWSCFLCFSIKHLPVDYYTRLYSTHFTVVSSPVERSQQINSRCRSMLPNGLEVGSFLRQEVIFPLRNRNLDFILNAANVGISINLSITSAALFFHLLL